MPVLETISSQNGAIVSMALIIKVTVATIIVTIGLIVGGFLGKLAGKFIKKLEIHKATRKAGLKIKPQVLAENVVKYVIYLAAAILALNTIGITILLINISFFIVITVLFIAMLLAIKDFVPNLLAGIYLHSKEHFKEGDRVRIRGVEGRITEINLIETKIKTIDNDLIILPNSLFTKSKVTKLNGNNHKKKKLKKSK